MDTLTDRDRINHAKSELRNYQYLSNVVEGFNNKLIDLDNRLTGLHGIDPSREPAGWPNPYSRDELLDKQQRLTMDRALPLARLSKIREFLDSLEFEDRKIVTDVYIKHVTIEDTATWAYCSVRTLKRRIDEILLRFE